MRTSRLSWIAVSLLLAANVAYGADSSGSRWVPPAIASAATQLPRLQQALVLDGDLKEWSGAACVPVRYRSYMEILQRPHEWRGPADAGMEFYSAWNADGLCLAAIVADDDVYTDRPDDLLWQQDCVEIFLDGRSGETFMTPPYSPGAYQLLVRPPTGQRPAGVWVKERDGKIDGLKIVGKRTATGYVVELLVPWGAFPEFKPEPGAEIAFQFRLDDYDKRDRDLITPMAMSYAGARDLWLSPQHFIRWVLADEPRAGAQVSLGPLVALDFPALFGYEKALPVSCELGRALSARVGSLHVSVVAADGEVVFDRSVKPSPLPAPWKGSLRAELAVPPQLPDDGYYTIRALVNDRQGRPLGVAVRPVLFVGRVAEDFLTRLEDVDLPTLSQTAPFEAAAYLGAGACLERLKRGVELFDFGMTTEAARELETRLDVLDDGLLLPGNRGLYDLLALTGEPEAQVVVEHPNPWTAWVTFYWGAIPLVSATVQQFGSAEAAAKALQPSDGLTTRVQAGNRLITVACPSKPVAERVAALISAGKPVLPSDVDAMRGELVKLLGPQAPPPIVPDGRSLFCGDVHMHTFYSDGRPSPVGLALQTMYSYMDFAVLTDHNTIEGARVGQKLLRDHGFGYPFTIGEEITMGWAHLNAYPLNEMIPWTLSPYDTIKAAHVQGAVIQWNHPEGVLSEWAKPLLEKGIDGTGLDAWEHIPPNYDAWKDAGMLPIIVGSTDSHDGTFAGHRERTIVFAPTAQGDDVAEAIRSGHVVALAWSRGRLIYGSDDMISRVWAALADGRALKAAKAERLRNALETADLPGLLRASQPRQVRLEELPAK